MKGGLGQNPYGLLRISYFLAKIFCGFCGFSVDITLDGDANGASDKYTGIAAKFKLTLMINYVLKNWILIFYILY